MPESGSEASGIFVTEPSSQDKKPNTGSAPGTTSLARDIYQRRGETAALQTSPLGEGTGPDSFERQAEEAPAQPSRPASGFLREGAAMRALVTSTLEKAQHLIGGLEQRVELMLRGCVAAELPVPSVEWGPYRYELSPNTAKVVAYMQRALRARPGLDRQVPVAIFRFQEARLTVAKVVEALEEGDLPPNLLEALKLKCFYLSRYHEEFKDDPVLRQLFPAPKDTAATGSIARRATAPLATSDLAKQQAREVMFAQAEAYLLRIAPRLQQLEAVLALIAQVQKKDLRTLLDPIALAPAARQARQAARKLAESPALVGQLRQGLQLHAQLLSELQAMRKGAGGDSFQEPYALFCQMMEAWRQDERVRSFFV